MTLHVTQCPGCKSTFNTSAAMLEAAGGRVRCGACLAVFQAGEHFLDPSPAGTSRDFESVFLGDQPPGDADPANLLTREALRNGSPGTPTEETGPATVSGRRPRRRPRDVLLILLLILGVGGLAVQFLWHNMDRHNIDSYSRLPWLRPLYAWACPGCVLPPRSDINAIAAEQLRVGSHPELDGALLVNLELHNTAGFAQAFPVLVLSFHTADGDIAALREFAPAEYLDPAGAETALLPPGPPGISLEIMDPGPAAVGHALVLRPYR